MSLQEPFVRERLPAREDWPEILPLEYVPQRGRFNIVEVLLDRHLQQDFGKHPALRCHDCIWTYEELADRVGRIANALKAAGAAPGNRVLLRGANTPELAAIWLACMRVGAIAVTTMPLLRARELAEVVDIVRPTLALCQDDLQQDLYAACEVAADAVRIIGYSTSGGELGSLAAAQTSECGICATNADDVALIALTSGTTGKPKATVHFHRDLLSICDVLCRHILQPQRNDVFVGTAPLAFTFGLGGLLVFPLYAGASSVLEGRFTSDQLIDAVSRHRATVCFAVPTFYQQMLKQGRPVALGSLRLAVSSGEALPLPVRDAWEQATGVELAELLGSTEMLHAFIGAAGEDIRRGSIGKALPGYRIAVVDAEGHPVAPGELGRLAVKGPTGCRYLADERQRVYVQKGWNITGDICSLGADGYVHYHSRADDMIISSGYNIAGAEVENALLSHPAVSECAVVGEDDAERGQVVTAYVVVRPGHMCDDALAAGLQEHVKAAIAPYKYPRIIRFAADLPRNESGKVQRFRLANRRLR